MAAIVKPEVTYLSRSPKNNQSIMLHMYTFPLWQSEVCIGV